jgi:hypothetical protein
VDTAFAGYGVSRAVEVGIRPFQRQIGGDEAGSGRAGIEGRMGLGGGARRNARGARDAGAVERCVGVACRIEGLEGVPRISAG